MKMEYMKHHAIIVTGWNFYALYLAYEAAIGIIVNHGLSTNMILPVSSEVANGYRSFAIYPYCHKHS